VKIVVVGDGKVGYTLTEQLSKEGHDLVVIDQNINALNNSANTLDVMAVQGNGASYSVQVQAGVPEADLLIAAASADEINILCCMVAKKLGVKHTIARVRNPEYAEQLVVMKEELGLSMSVNPEFAAAQEISRILGFPAATKIESFAKGRVELVEFKLEKGTPLHDLPLSSLYAKYQVKVLICAVQREGEVYIPTGDFVLREGDRIHITAAPAQIALFFKKIKASNHKIRTVMIVGGGKITFYLTRLLQAMGISVKVIESDLARCQNLSRVFPKAMIIQGDGTEKELLQEEGLAQMDAFVALTGSDEENIILSMYADSQKVGKVVTKINRMAFPEILDNTGIETVISPKYIIANQIIRYVRAMQNSVGSNVETLHKIVNNQAEALEFRVSDRFGFAGVPLKDLKLKSELLIATIIRQGKIIIPGGGDTIEVGDSVIVVTTNRYLKDLDDILR